MIAPMQNLKKIVALGCMLAIVCACLVPATAHAASKKTVYVVSAITVHKKNGSVVDRYKYTYNKHGLVKKKVFSTYGSPSHYYLTYNSAGQIKKIKETEYDGSTSSVEKYTYKDGVLAKKKYTWYGLDTTGKQSYTFDDEGKLVRKEGGNDDGTNQFVEKFTYYANGLMKTDKGAWESKRYKYDKKGSVAKEYNGSKLFRKYSNTYVSKSSKRLKKVTYRYSSGKAFGYHIYTYKKMKVSKADAKLVKAQQVQACNDPVFELFW